MLVFPPGPASPQTSSWAPTRRGWRWAAPRCSSASAMSPETSASPSTSCSLPTAAPSVCRLTRKCTSSCFTLNVHKLEGKKENLQVRQRNGKLESTSSLTQFHEILSPNRDLPSLCVRVRVRLRGEEFTVFTYSPDVSCLLHAAWHVFCLCRHRLLLQMCEIRSGALSTPALYVNVAKKWS